MATRSRRPGESGSDYAESGALFGDPDIAGQPVGYDPLTPWRSGAEERFHDTLSRGVGPQQSPLYGPAALSMLGPQGTMNRTGVGRMMTIDPVGPRRTMLGTGPAGAMGRTGAGRIGLGSALMNPGMDERMLIRGQEAGPGASSDPMKSTAGQDGLDKWLERAYLGAMLAKGGVDFFNERSDRKRAERREEEEAEDRRGRSGALGRALVDYRGR